MYAFDVHVTANWLANQTGDDVMIALQVRGGPEPYMVSSWIQILKLRPDNIGTYTCTVTNVKGMVQASAGVNLNQVITFFSLIP